MNPLSLLTLPTDALREAAARAAAASPPSGERHERLYALTLLLALISAPIGALLI